MESEYAYEIAQLNKANKILRDNYDILEYKIKKMKERIRSYSVEKERKERLETEECVMK